MKRSIVYIVLAISIVSGSINLNVPIYAFVGLDIYNDTNIYNFSDSDLSRISAADGLLTDDETRASAIIKPRITLEYGPYINNQPLEIKLSASPKFALHAKIKNTLSLSSSARYKIKPYTYFRIWHSYIPSIYIRNFRDRDDLIHTGSFVDMNDGCWFAQEKLGLSYTTKISNRSLITRSIALISMYFENPFDEFNLRIIDFGLGVKYLENKSHTVSFESHASYADNYTRLTGRRSVDSFDRGYTEIMFGYSYEKKNIFNNQSLRIGLSGRFIARKYISNFEQDPIHYRRYQNDNLFTFWIKINTQFGISLKPFISYRIKDVSSPDEWVEDLKGFDKYNIGIKLGRRMAFDIL